MFLPWNRCAILFFETIFRFKITGTREDGREKPADNPSSGRQQTIVVVPREEGEKKKKEEQKKSNMGGEEVLETSTFDEASTPDAIPANSLMRESIR